jgi:hypothetical protein
MTSLAMPAPALCSFLPPAPDFASHALALGAAVAAARATGPSAPAPQYVPLLSGFYVPLVARNSATAHLPLPIISHQLPLCADAPADAATAPMLLPPGFNRLFPPAVAAARVPAADEPPPASGRKRPRPLSMSGPPAPPASGLLTVPRLVPGNAAANPAAPLSPPSRVTARAVFAQLVSLPSELFEGVGASTVPVYTEAITRFREYLPTVGRTFPTPITAPLLGDFFKYMVTVRNRSSGSIPTWQAALSRLADYFPGCAAERSKLDKRHLARVIRGITLHRPVAPVGRAELPFAALVTAVRALSISALAADQQFLARLLLILNAGARAGETNCRMLTLDNIYVITARGGTVDHIRLDMLFSKTRKHSAEPVYKYLFPRSDALDAVAPLLRYLRSRHGYSPPAEASAAVPAPIAVGGQPLFPLPSGKRNADTTAVTTCLRRVLRAAGLSPPELAAVASHSCRATLTTWLKLAGISLERITELMAWGSADMKSTRCAMRYMRENVLQQHWREANSQLQAFLLTRR